MTKLFERLRVILLEEPTGNVRFFFGLISIGYAMFLPSTVGHYMYRLAFEWVNPWLWCTGFMVSGIALVVGSIQGRPSRTMFVLEGVLSGIVWGGMGLATTLSQGMPGPTLFACFIAGWIFVRYPAWK